MKKILILLLPVFFGIAASILFKNTYITIAAVVIAVALVAYLERADILFLIGSHKYTVNREEGIKWLKRAYETEKMSPKGTLLYAYLLLRAGDLEQADSIINKTLYLGKKLLNDAEIKNAELNRALIYWKQGNLNDAIMTCEQLYEDGYNTASLFGSLAYFYIANSEYDKSIELSLQGREMYPDDLIIADNLGQAYMQNSMVEKSEEIYSWIFTKSPDFIEPFYNYGQLLEKRGELANAAQYYQQALLCQEKFLSTTTHAQVEEALANVNELLL